ncbi:MAG: penicillin-binding protein activator [Deltaproteobacteria bacterium]|nr:penicillin-binding protein activator [Deltaproteobacteria bacterium]
MRPLSRILVALCLVAAGCPKRVVVNGQEMSEADARSRGLEELARARADLARAPPEKAAEGWEAVAARLGETPEAAEAWFQAGIAWRGQRRPDRASAAFGQLLARFPLAPQALAAKRELGLSQLEEGRPKDALSTLSSLYDKLAPEERLPVARAAARAAERAGQPVQAVRFRAEAVRLTEGSEREHEQLLLADAVDQLPFLDVARLREELPADSPALPPLLLKLAKVRWHLRDAEGAQAEARELTGRYPGTSWAAEAQALLDRLSRRSRVLPNVVGVAVPLSGRFKAWGEAILEGVAMGLGEGFRLVVKDTRGEPDGAAQALEELALAEGAIAVIGGVANAEAPRAAQAAQELELPFLSLAKTERVTDAGPYVFRVMLTAEAQARAIASWAMGKRGMRRFALLYPNIPYGLELASAFWDEVEARGGEIRGAESYDHDRTSFAPLVKGMVGKLWLDERQDYVEQVKELAKEEKDPFRRRKALEKLRDRIAPITDFDAVFVPDFAKNVGYVAPALAVEDVVTATCDSREVEKIRKTTGREDLMPVQLIGTNGWNDPQLLERAGRYVECAVFVDGFYAASQRPETRRFVEAFHQKYAHSPTILEASAHDAARLVRLSLERGARSRDALRSELSRVKEVPGATGDLSFDARREVQKQLFFLTVEGRAVRELTPAEVAGPEAGPPAPAAPGR